MELLTRFKPPKSAAVTSGGSEVVPGGSDRATEIELTDWVGVCVCVCVCVCVRGQEGERDECERVCERRNVKLQRTECKCRPEKQ